MDQRAVDKGDGRLPRLLRVDEMAERRLRRDDLGPGRLHPGVAAGVITVMVGVDDVANRLIRHRLEHRQDIGRVHFELVIDQHHAFVGDERRRVARDERIVDDEQVVLDLDQIQFRRLIAELLAVNVRHDQQQQESGTHRDACLHASHLRTHNAPQAGRARAHSITTMGSSRQRIFALLRLYAAPRRCYFSFSWLMAFCSSNCFCCSAWSCSYGGLGGSVFR